MNILAPLSTSQHHVSISSDVIQDMRVNVCEENSEKVIWYKVN